MATDLAPRTSALAVPTRQELEALGPGDRWTLEERLGDAQVILREFNDRELRHWVELEGKTYAEIAKIVGRSTTRISERSIRLGLQPKSNRGRPRISGPGNSALTEEVIDAEIIEDPAPWHDGNGEFVVTSPASAPPASGPMDVHFSSATDDWATPQDLFDELDREFGLQLDVCASNENAKCSAFYTAEQDGLSQPWAGTCWMNPPYGEVIGKWVEKARVSATEGATVVCLVPARVDTGWWWDNCLAGEIRFLRGRLRFGGGAAGAPFPSAVVVFGPDVEPAVRWWKR